MSLDVATFVSTESKDSIAGVKRFKVDALVEIETLENVVLMASGAYLDEWS